MTRLIPNSRCVLRISASISSRPGGSSPAVGSSSKHENGVVHQRLRELDPLLHAGRVAADCPVALLEQPDVAQRVRCADARMARRQAARLGHVREELGGAHRRGQAVVLGHVAEPRPDLLVAPGLPAEHLGAPGGRPRQTEEELDRRALAGAVRAEQAGDGCADLERDVVEGGDRAVALGQVLGPEQHVHAGIVLASRGSGLPCSDRSGPASPPAVDRLVADLERPCYLAHRLPGRDQIERPPAGLRRIPLPSPERSSPTSRSRPSPESEPDTIGATAPHLC